MLLFIEKLIRKCLSGLSAIADKTIILLTKSKDKLCHGLKTPVSGFIVRRFKVLKSMSFVTKES